MMSYLAALCCPLLPSAALCCPVPHLVGPCSLRVAHAPAPMQPMFPDRHYDVSALEDFRWTPRWVGRSSRANQVPPPPLPVLLAGLCDCLHAPLMVLPSPAP